MQLGKDVTWELKSTSVRRVGETGGSAGDGARSPVPGARVRRLRTLPHPSESGHRKSEYHSTFKA